MYTLILFILTKNLKHSKLQGNNLVLVMIDVFHNISFNKNYGLWCSEKNVNFKFHLLQLWLCKISMKIVWQNNTWWKISRVVDGYFLFSKFSVSIVLL